MINDVLAIEGVKQDNVNFIKRYNKIHEIINNKYHPLPQQKFNIQIKRYFKLNDIEQLMNFKNQLNYTTRGIILKPMFLKFRDILFNFDDSLIDNKRKVKYSENNKFIESISTNNNLKNLCTSKESTNVDITTNTKVIANKILEIEKTEKPDVFNLYDDSKKHIGIACISTLKTSKLLHNAFKTTKLTEKIKFECEYTDKFSNKWIPVVMC